MSTALATLDRSAEVAPSVQSTAGMIEVAQSRAAQEVQAKMVIAKKCPRDQTAAFSRIMQACRRKSLAESAVYAYPRGNETVSGPSIRLAEVMAQNWGNIDFGIVELEQKRGESIMQAYCWDLETNAQQTKIFTVKHERHTKRGTTFLTDPRDIYEMTANQGARRLRACILGIIPGDIVDAAVAECDKTMAGGNTEPIADRVRKMVEAFASMGVTSAMIEARLHHKLDTATETELVQLRKIYKAIADNMGSVDQYFEMPGAEPTPTPAGQPKGDGIAEKLRAAAAATAPPVDQQPAGPARWEQLVVKLAEKCGVDDAAARKRLDASAKAYRKPFHELDDATLDKIAAQIEAGDINVKAE